MSVSPSEKKPLIPEKYQSLAFIAALIIAVFVFYGKAIFGNGFESSDTIASMSFKNYIAQANKAAEFPLWTPNIFCGMPSFGALLTTGDRSWDIVAQIVFKTANFVGVIFGNDLARVIFYYALYAVGMFLLARIKGMSRWAAFFVGLAAVFSTFISVWAMIGHLTKPVALATFPYIFICLEKLKEKFKPMYLLLLIFAVHTLSESTHVQMLFYELCGFGLYFVFELIRTAIKKEGFIKVIRAGLLLALAGGLSYLMSSDRYMSAMEYTPYSTRGSGPIVQSNNNKQDASGGNDYNYATNWSFSPEEIKTFFVPNFYGFGQLEYKGSLTGNKAMKIPTYWGQMPFTDAANYMGAFVLLFAIVGFIGYRKNMFVQFLALLSIFSLFLSFGKNLPVLYDLFYYHVPSFNKFRAPSIALALMQFAIPILAGYGIMSMKSWRENFTNEGKKLLYGLVGFSGLFLIFGFLYSGMFEADYIEAAKASENLSRYNFPNEIFNFIYSSMINDWYVTALLALGASIAAYMFVKKKITEAAFGVALALLVIIDLWRVDYRDMEVAKKPIEASFFQNKDYIEFLKSDKSKFRIFENQIFQTPNIAAYYGLESVNGYHSAKLRVMQDLIDVADQGSTSYISNPFLWKLMNVKYILTDKPLNGIEPIFKSDKGVLIYANQCLNRTEFVKTAVVSDKIAILSHLKAGDFNPLDTAFIEEPINKTFSAPQAGDTSYVTNYKNEEVDIKTKTSGDRLMLISEIYYPGWKASIDGKDADIYKTNFAFRSVVVPQGEHTLTFKFESKKYESGRNYSLITNIAVLAFGVVSVGMFFFKKKKDKDDPQDGNED